MTPVPLTIVIPVYNRADIVTRTLDTVFDQTFRPLRLIVVDNASTDSTLDVVNGWARAHRRDDFDISVVDEPRPGAAAARNAGLALVESEWTMFFDSDDTMRPGHVARAMQAVSDHPEADVIGWDVCMYMSDNKSSVKPFARARQLYNCIIDGTWATLRYMARTCIFREAGAWDPSVSTWDDIEMGTRILTMPRYLSIHKIKGPHMVDILSHEASISGLDLSHNAPRIDYALDLIYNTLPQKYKYIANLRRAIVAGHYIREGRAAGQDNSAISTELIHKALASTSKPQTRWLLRIARTYTACGGRGAGKILKYLFRP